MKIIPFLTILSLIFLASFFFVVYFNLILLITFFIFSILILYSYNKKIIINCIFIFFCYSFHHFRINNLFAKIEKIQEAKQIFGIVIDKKKLKNNFFYIIKGQYIKNKESIIPFNEYIKLLTQKNLLICQYISCKKLHHLKCYKNLNEFKKDSFNNGFSGFIISNKIEKLNKNNIYEKIYYFTKLFFAYKEKLINKINTVVEENNINLFKTILLGEVNKNFIIKKLFNEWGIIHYLARSGIHIQIIISLLSGLFLFIGISYKKNIILQTTLLGFFYFCSFSSISFLRSFFMFILFNLFQMLKIKTTSLHIVSLVIIIILFINPFSFLLLGTQLTFLTTFILCLINYQKYQI